MFVPCTYGRAPAIKLIGVPSLRYVAKSPPSAAETDAVPKVIVDVVNWSVPDAEKYPEIVAACATVPNVSAETSAMNFSNGSPGSGMSCEYADYCMRMAGILHGFRRPPTTPANSCQAPKPVENSATRSSQSRSNFHFDSTRVLLRLISLT